MPGLGCALLRWSLIHKHALVFRTVAEPPDRGLGLDIALYHDLRRHGYVTKALLLPGLAHWAGASWLENPP